MENIIVTLPNVNLKQFSNLLDQSLLVNAQLMLEFDSQLIKSCSFSSTRSMIKLITINTNDLVSGNSFEPFESFNFYILNGSLFKQELASHTSETIDLSFTISNINGKYQAKLITIKGELLGSVFETNFELTTESMITDSISDYNAIISACSPTDDMDEIILTNKQIIEIKRQIKNLHKAIANNTSYLTFNYNHSNQSLQIKDKVFNIQGISMPENFAEITDRMPHENFSFDVLKSDFVKLGNLTFSIYTNNQSEKIILLAKYGKSLIAILITKIDKNTSDDSQIDCLDSLDIDDLDMSEYIG